MSAIPTFAGALNSQSTSPELARQLDPALERLTQDFEFPGLAVGVVRNGVVAYVGTFGRARKGDERPITPDSIFHMASLSKPFVATVIMKLVEAGELDLDAPVVKYLPYFQLLDERSGEITLRQILTHSSGMPDVTDYQWDRPESDPGALERFIRSLNGVSLIFAPGSDQRYSNMAFDVLGDVIAKVSGASFEEVMATEILQPLGMSGSSFMHAATQPENWTTGHSNSFSPLLGNPACTVFPYNRRHAPSSTLCSSVSDMSRWLLANLARGRLGACTLVSEQAHDQLIGAGKSVAQSPSIGLAWLRRREFGVDWVYHSGQDLGFTSLILFAPALQLGVVCMLNSDQAPILEIGKALAVAGLGMPFQLPLPSVRVPIERILESKGIDEAVRSFETLLETRESDFVFGPDELTELGIELLNRGRRGEALELLALNAATYPDSARCKLLLQELLEASMGKTAGDQAQPDQEGQRLGHPAVLPVLSESQSVAEQLAKDELQRVVQGAARLMAENYVFVDLAQAAADHLRTRLAQGAYTGINTRGELAQELTGDLRAKCRGDLHIELRLRRAASLGSDSLNRKGRAPYANQNTDYLRSQNWGFLHAEILEGNIGYLKISYFERAERGGDAARAALAFLANTDALIFDLRGNTGGSVTMVRLLASYFFKKRTLLETTQWRNREQRDKVFTDVVSARINRAQLPLFIVQDARSISAPEMFAYCLQAERRAVIVGQTSAGAANSNSDFDLDEHFVMAISTGVSVNPITGTNWEGRGVVPDVPMRAERAVDAAHALALRSRLEVEKDADERKRLALYLRRSEARRDAPL